MDKNSDGLVVGAGIAGLAAAAELAKAGQRVTLLEAQERTGGRVLTVPDEDVDGPVELGAEFIHGRPPELIALLKQAGIPLEEVRGTDYCFDGSSLSPCPRDGATALLDNLAEFAGQHGDMSFDSYLARHPAAEEEAQEARSFVEGFNAADAARIGIAALAFQQQAEEEIDGARAFRAAGGYAQVVEYLEQSARHAGVHIVLGSEVTRLRWSEGRVTADAAGQQYQASHAILTLPLGVLQERRIAFDPVPQTTLDAADRMAMGAVQRIVLIFRSAFWEEKAPGMSFLFAEGTTPSTWWTQHPRQRPVLVGWVGGPRATQGNVADARCLLQEALHSLERIFAMPDGSLQRELRSWRLHDWQRDAWSLGAYSYAPAGALECSTIMARPVLGTLFFAGEHTDTTGHWGTVHGALRSGMRAAQQVMAKGT